ncbi:MAG TPA: glycosyltransferase family 4 protein [Gemmatimonadota bacterium]|nr:glycosyltransferase family 4 protein [Gemmatimonadota bacterium]
MRILLVNALGFVGGAEKWIVNLTARLVPRGHAVEVAHDPRSPLGELARAAGAEAWVPRGGFRGSLRTGPALAREIRARGIEVVVTTTRTDLKIGGFAARLAGHPGAVARLNSGWDPAAPIVTSGLKWRRRRRYHRHFVQLAATNSRAGKADVVARGYLPPERVVTIYNGVDFSRFDPDHVPPGAFRAELGMEPDDPLVVSISRYVERKGQEFELEAAGRLTAERPGLHFAFLGPCRDREMPYKERLIARARLLPGRDRIHFLGARDDVPAVLADADVLVRAALTEGLPNVALEAMAMRVPVVATGICGTPEAVLDGETGRLVPPADDRAIRAAVAELLDLPLERRAAMGHSGRRHVLATFGLDRMADEYEALFERALAERGGRTGAR